MSSSTLDRSTRLVLMPLKRGQDVVLCRNRARSIAAALRFDRQHQVRIATAVSEIARNAFTHAREAAAEFSVNHSITGSGSRRPTSFVAIVRDRGPGIVDLASILAGTYQSGSCMGILGAKRLMDVVHIETGTSGTTVRLEQRLPKGVNLKPIDLQGVAEEITRSSESEPLEELGMQNQELITTMDQLDTQRVELGRINDELIETNRGVGALYDELDTVQRVGRILASKLELPALLQAITDATVDVSGAECGGFFRKELPGESFTCQNVSGPLGIALENCSLTNIKELTGIDRPVFRVDDVLAEKRPFPINRRLPVRSFLALAVHDPSNKIVGALVLGHRSPAVFTERTERILTVVAMQASMGLQNAQLYGAAQAASAAKDQFLAILSHELRTPLTPIFAVLASIERYPDLPDRIRPDLAVISRNLQLETQLIDDLLDLTRISSGKFSLRREITDVHTLSRSVSKLCGVDIEKQQIRFELHLGASRFHVLGDAGRLQQVLWNLLNNAIKFCNVGGKIELQTSVVGNANLVIRLTDDGRGISPEMLDRIFQPFEQGDISTPRFGGLGLGLAITKYIVDAHQGQIWAQSPGAGKGATFTVSLPLVETEQSAEAPRPKHPAVNRPVRILLAEDHADTLDVMSRFLTLCGHEVVAASSYEQALSFGQQREFDLLISDLGLRDGTGYDLMARLRAVSSVKGIALSGYGMAADIARSLAAGFSAHLTKPCDASALNAAIQKVLS
jgi:signal transduction histidine kinase